MGARGRQLRAVEKGFSFVVVAPVFAWLKTGDHRMPARVKMFGTVLARRIITATYMSAFGAAPQVQPPATARQALDATNPTRFHCGIDSSSASVVCVHCVCLPRGYPGPQS